MKEISKLIMQQRKADEEFRSQKLAKELENENLVGAGVSLE